MENKIAKTENSIKLLEEHLTNRTCPKSLRYTAKPNITPNDIFEKELKDIKLDAEQSLVDALTRFHKRKLEGQKKKLRAFSQPNARRNKYVTRQPFNDSQSVRYGAAPHTLTLFKTNIANFPTHFKTEFRFLIPCLRHLTQFKTKIDKSLP